MAVQKNTTKAGNTVYGDPNNSVDLYANPENREGAIQRNSAATELIRRISHRQAAKDRDFAKLTTNKDGLADTELEAAWGKHYADAEAMVSQQKADIAAFVKVHGTIPSVPTLGPYTQFRGNGDVTPNYARPWYGATTPDNDGHGGSISDPGTFYIGGGLFNAPPGNSHLAEHYSGGTNNTVVWPEDRTRFGEGMEVAMAANQKGKEQAEAKKAAFSKAQQDAAKQIEEVKSKSTYPTLESKRLGV
jgi:hypothetical protein